MASIRPSHRLLPRIAALCIITLVASITPASAQTAPDAIPEAPIDDLVGFTIIGNPYTTDDPWVDPIGLAGLDPNELVPAPDFDPIEFHESPIFAAGVDLVPTHNSELDAITANHVRTLQVLATLDRDIDDIANEIEQDRPTIDRLLAQIDVERTNEARLAREISVFEEAVTEFALRAFIGEDDIETLSDANGSANETRVVSDEVREDQFEQLDKRREELVEREKRRIGLQGELREARGALRVLRDERLHLLQTHGEIAKLPDRTKATYQVALHTRLPQFVEGSNIPLVALNAYVIAERTLATEQPQCGITWSMLAGIGHIESFHGHFANSTLDINGHTTEDIRGPALDGRILEGAEFINAGDEVPDPTARTEVLPVPQTPGDGEAPTEATPVPEEAAPTEQPADPADSTPADTDTPGNVEAGDADPATQAPPEPPRVIRRLALIEDSDDGLLDGDTTFDRAVGPMQFIPSTWRLFEQDGNLDDERDPQNIYDASLASARYLCASTATMTTVAGELRAYFAYNHDEQYSQNVLRTGLRYRALIDVPEPETAETNDDANNAASNLSDIGLADPDRDPLVIELQVLQQQLATLNLPDFTAG